MASAIDSSKPADGEPAVKADLRANLQAVKQELDHGGFAATLSPLNYGPPVSTKVEDHLASIDAALAQGNADGMDYTVPHTGAVTRSIRDRLAQALNVKDFGAMGNGSTDDRNAIQNAMNAVPTNGGVLFFPAGHYRVDSTINIPTINTTAGGSFNLGITKPIHFLGETFGHGMNVGSPYRGASTLEYTPTTGRMFNCVGSTNRCQFFGSFQGLALIHTGSGTSNTAIALHSIKGSHFQDLHINGFAYGIDMPIYETGGIKYLGHGWYSTFRRVYTREQKICNVRLSVTNGVSFVQCQFSNGLGLGVQLGYPDAESGFSTGDMARAGWPTSFIGTYFEGNNDYGLLAYGATFLNFDDCYCEFNNDGGTRTAMFKVIGCQERSCILNLRGNYFFPPNPHAVFEVDRAATNAEVVINSQGNWIASPGTGMGAFVQATAGAGTYNWIHITDIGTWGGKIANMDMPLYPTNQTFGRVRAMNSRLLFHRDGVYDKLS